MRQAARRRAIAKAVEAYRGRSGLYSCYVQDAATDLLNPRSFVLQRLDNGDVDVRLYVGDEPLSDVAKRALAKAEFVGHERTIARDDDVFYNSLPEVLDGLMLVMGADDHHDVRCQIVDNPM